MVLHRSFSKLLVCVVLAFGWGSALYAQAGLERHLGPIAQFADVGQSGVWTGENGENWYTLSNPTEKGTIRYYQVQVPALSGRDLNLKSFVHTSPSAGDISHAGILFNFVSGEQYFAATVSSDGGGYLFVRTPDGFNVNRAEDVTAKLDGSDVLEVTANGGEVTALLNGNVMFVVRMQNGPSDRFGIFAAGAGTAAFTQFTVN